jgi:hypothetical protein
MESLCVIEITGRGRIVVCCLKKVKRWRDDEVMRWVDEAEAVKRA